MDVEELVKNPPFSLTQVDVKTLRQTDEEYEPHTWTDLKEKVTNNQLDLLARIPSDLYNYIYFTNHVRSAYGSITAYVLQNLLKWEQPVSPVNPAPFADANDYRIVRNDWPYGVAPDVAHLIIWLKTMVQVDEAGDPTPEMRGRINSFVDSTFKSKIKPALEGTEGEQEKVMWFRNRTQWQSVRAVEHIHILVRGVDEALIEEWTGGQKSEDIEARRWKNGKKV